jgi:hypothetical protein
MKASGVDRAVRQDVADLLVRYASAIDRRDWELLRSCFSDDCVADYGDIGRWSGGDEITEWMLFVLEEKGQPVPSRLASAARVAEVALVRLPLGPVYSWGPFARLRAGWFRTRVRVFAALSRKVFGADRLEGSTS